MKISKTLIGLIALSLFTLSSCDKDSMCTSGEGGKVTQTLNLGSFKQIDLVEAADVHIHQGPEQIVTVTAPSNIIGLLDQSVSGERWDIDFGTDCAKDYSMTIDITVPHLNEVILSGSGNIQLSDFEGEANLDLTLSGSGDISVGGFTQLKNVTALISGSGNIRTTQDMADLNYVEAVISGSGNFNGFGFLSDQSDVLISGSGNIETTASDALSIKISGSGNVYYRGQPAINTDISGSGNVINRN